MMRPRRVRLPALAFLLALMLAGLVALPSAADEGTAVAEPPAVPTETETEAPTPPGAETEAEAGAPPAPAPGPSEASEAPDAAGEGQGAETAASDDAEGLEEVLARDRTLVILIALLRFGTAFVGAWLLLRFYRDWSRSRAGLPTSLAHPVGATTIATPLFGVLAFLLYYLAPAVLREAYVRMRPGEDPPPGLGVAALIVVGGALVVGLLMRHRRLATAPRRSPGRVVLGGFLTFCVGNALAVPALFVGAALLQSLGQDVTTYQVVEQAVDPAHPQMLWITAFLAVVVAPVVEETIFRGALYPALRDAAGGGRRGVWVGAIAVSLIFAGIHGHPASFLPLFCLALVFAWVYELTDSLGTVILAHAFFNAASMIPLLIARAKGLL